MYFLVGAGDLGEVEAVPVDGGEGGVADGGEREGLDDEGAGGVADDRPRGGGPVDGGERAPADAVGVARQLGGGDHHVGHGADGRLRSYSSLNL